MKKTLIYNSESKRFFETKRGSKKLNPEEEFLFDQNPNINLFSVKSFHPVKPQHIQETDMITKVEGGELYGSK